MSKSNENVITYFLGLIMILAVLGGVASIALNYGNHDEAIITVQEKERAEQQRTGGYYLIFGVDENDNPVVYANRDLFWEGIFDCSDTQSKIQIGSTYRVKLVGHRVPFFNTYQNIVGFELMERGLIMKYYKVPEDEFKELLKEAYSYHALLSGGVDNWDGYSQSFREFIEAANNDNNESYESLDDIVEHDLSKYYVTDYE